MSKPRRVTSSLPLMLVASATVASLSACNEDPNAGLANVRDQYKSLEDCAQDWGSTVPCQPEQAPAGSNTVASTGNTSGGGTMYTGRYHGPSYNEGQRDIAQRSFNAHPGDHAVGRSVTRSVSRGGFGSSSRGFSGGG